MTSYLTDLEYKKLLQYPSEDGSYNKNFYKKDNNYNPSILNDSLSYYPSPLRLCFGEMETLVPFTSTNESLESIVKGLDISPSDRVLAVAGSGDQSLALLENAHDVTAVDINPRQIEFFRQRIRALLAGDFSLFYLEGALPEVASYFTQERLSRIKANLKNLTLRTGDVLDVAQTEPGFSKVYLSNIFSYGLLDLNKKFVPNLTEIAKNLPLEGLIYVADHRELSRVKYGSVSLSREIEDSSFLPLELILDVDLTTKARRANTHVLWGPAVYRRV